MKVAAYARVSTGSEEQYTSFKNQLSYFTEKIISEGNELIKLYADEGLTGTNFKRKGFIDMLYDAGIDFIKINNQEIFVLSDSSNTKLNPNMSDSVYHCGTIGYVGGNIKFTEAPPEDATITFTCDCDLPYKTDQYKM